MDDQDLRSDAAACAKLGLVSLQKSRFDEARRLLSRATKLEPDNAIYWEYLAELHGRLEQFPAAIRCWERVLAQTPDDRRTHTSPSAAHCTS